MNAPPRGRTLEVVEDGVEKEGVGDGSSNTANPILEGHEGEKAIAPPPEVGGGEELREQRKPTHRQPRKLRRRKRKALVGR